MDDQRVGRSERESDDTSDATRPAEVSERAAPRELRPVPEPSRAEAAVPVRPPASVATLPKRQRRPIRTILMLLGPVVLIAGALWLYLGGGRYASTDDSYIESDKQIISTDVSGIVTDVEVHENDTVKTGQVLFRLDEEPFQIALAGAQAQLGIVKNQIDTLKATYKQNVVQIQQARTDVALYQRTFQREQDLSAKGAASFAQLDQAQHDISAANDRVLLAQRNADATLAQLGGSADEITEQDPNYLLGKAQVDAANRNLRHAVVRAPMDGVVTNVTALQVGQYLQAAQGAFSLVRSGHHWVQAFLKETDLGYVTPGSPATISVDTYPGRVWRAKVASISPATGAEFSVLPAQNSSGNWVKVVQRIPVRLRVEVPDDAPPLRAGMSTIVDIDTGHTRSIGDLVEAAKHWF